MNQPKIKHLTATLLPCILFSAIAGALSGGLIFAFKLLSSRIIHTSNTAYAYVRANPKWLPLLLFGALLLGLFAAWILHLAKDSRGGGIPVAVAAIRGLRPLRWMQGVFVVFFSSLLTYLGGVPLGSEGPSVQMGAAVGKGTVNLISRRRYAWDRYLMTGGACAGFATALGAPLTGILFAVEEAHRRFSPMIFTTAAVAVFTGTVTQDLLSVAFDRSHKLFDFSFDLNLPLRLLWIALIIGAVAGVAAILFTRIYRFMQKVNTGRLGSVPISVKIPLIFLAVALLGFFSEDLIGSGHELIEKILHGEAVWYLLLIAMLVRPLLMIAANNAGISGGMFVPMLAFGAIVAALIAETVCSLELVDESYYAVLIAIGMAAFLAAASRTPITALAFSIEVLCGVGNALPVGVGIVVAYLIIEFANIPAFNDTVIEAKTAVARRGKTPVEVDTKWTVQPNAFAIGYEARDILWPSTCTVLSIDKSKDAPDPSDPMLGVGDVVQLHYQTYDPDRTIEILSHILGDQTETPKMKTKHGRRRHQIPMD